MRAGRMAALKFFGSHGSNPLGCVLLSCAILAQGPAQSRGACNFLQVALDRFGIKPGRDIQRLIRYKTASICTIGKCEDFVKISVLFWRQGSKLHAPGPQLQRSALQALSAPPRSSTLQAHSCSALRSALGARRSALGARSSALHVKPYKL